MHERNRLALYERTVTPHLNASYNLARWLTRSDEDAQDVVQEGCLRAFRAIDGFHGGDGRAWVLAIVRNAAYSWLRRNRNHDLSLPIDDRLHDIADDGQDPEAAVFRRLDREALARAIEELPAEYREVIVLREVEDLSYKEIAQIADVPLGTVMSRLSRARQRLQQRIAENTGQGATR